MKMYILVLDTVPLGLAINAVGHASLVCFLDSIGERSTQRWLAESFKKVTCKVSEHELEAAMCETSYSIIRESSLVGNPTVAVAFAPRENWPDVFKTFQLFR